MLFIFQLLPTGHVPESGFMGLALSVILFLGFFSFLHSFDALCSGAGFYGVAFIVMSLLVLNSLGQAYQGLRLLWCTKTLAKYLLHRASGGTFLQDFTWHTNG